MKTKRRLRVLRRIARRAIGSTWLQRWAKPRINQRGDVLDPQVATLLMLQRLSPDNRTSVATRRASMRASCFLGAGRVPEMITEETEIAGLRTRWYRVPHATHALIYLHGGGWVVGGLDTADVLCRRLALGSARTVISVEYPLAPEHPWPAAVHAVADLWRAFDHGAFTAVGIGGDSAGGNLAAAVASIVDGIDVQFLLYPGLDATRVGASHAEFSDQGLLLEREAIELYLRLYAPVFDDPLASPVLAHDLQGLPPALIAVAGFDPLRDEGLLYAERLRQAGVPVELHDFTGLPHGFGNIDGLVHAAAQAVDTLAAALRA